MDLDKALHIVKEVLAKNGSIINTEDYDGLIVKRLSMSNTISNERETSNQTHIAITGAQMDMFPYVHAEGYFSPVYSEADSGLKKYFVAQIPAYLDGHNVGYISENKIQYFEERKKVYISIVRSRRKTGGDQIQMSLLDSDSPEFIEFRRYIPVDGYLVLLKRKEEIKYDCFAIKHNDGSCEEGSLEELNNKFFKAAVITKVEIDKIVESDKKEMNMKDGTKLPDRNPRQNSNLHLNSILYGAPGTGKTYSTAEYALKIVDPGFKADSRAAIMKKYREYINSGRIVFTTFHQSYGYEDFIQGLRPNSNSGNLNFEPVDGIFKRIADKAMYDTENDYVIIIDEINRANISKVFGELITLIEDNKRWGEVNALSVTLPSGEVFAVPNNLYIIGTMNSADKSISLIDTALRRRFEFVEFVPRAELVTNELLKEIIVKLNKALKDEFENTDLLIGHAYFINKSEDDLCDIMNNSVIPLLYEYNYDNAKKVKTQLNEVLKDTDFKISASEFGRIKIEKSDANA